MAAKKSKKAEEETIVGEAAREGAFADVVAGEHAGRYGVYVDTLNREDDGSPKTILLRTRDDNDELLTLPYGDCVLAESGRR